jgi:hypothetical protein
VIGLGVAIITFIVAFFVKENKKMLYTDNVHKKQIETSKE